MSAPPRSMDDVRLALIFGCAIFLQIICGGIRFVDGSILLQFSQFGFRAELKEFSQYLFDSPLKVLLLKLLDFQSVIGISILFIIANILPLITAAAVARDKTDFFSIMLVCCAMPLWKIMFQNIGIGDSFIISCAIVVVASRSSLLLTTISCIMLLWHFQQGILIAFYVCALLVTTKEIEYRERFKAIAMGAAVGAAIFVLLKIFLIPSSSSRFQFIFSQMGSFFLRNILYIPIALCAAIPGLLLISQSLARMGGPSRSIVVATIWAAIALSVLIGIITTDVSRVIVILTFPLALFLTRSSAFSQEVRTYLTNSSMLVPLLAIGIVTPIYSWSGVDIFLWNTLFSTLQKYGFM